MPKRKEAKAKDRFNEVYMPDKTDVETKLPFIKKGTPPEMVELFLGNFLFYWHVLHLLISLDSMSVDWTTRTSSKVCSRFTKISLY